jgi:hypothetical protein
MFKQLGLSVGVVALVLGAAACSSSSPPQGGDASTGIDPVNPNPTDCAKNPYGVCYPTKTGYEPKKASIRGDSIPNLKFLGYTTPDTKTIADVMAQKQVSLAEYFDPEMRKYKVVHLTVSSVWCGPCNQETQAIAGGIAANLEPLGVVFVQMLADGPVLGTGATFMDLTSWVNKHKTNFTVLLDPGAAQMGQFFPAASVPFNVTLDARTMEILKKSSGYNPGMEDELKAQVDWVKSNPAKPL